jgi:hypothetical protein
MATRRLLASFVLALLCAALGTTAADMYCGQENCYDVLGLKEHATDGEVRVASALESPTHGPTVEAH